jgi:hypothetical protein
VAGKFISHAPRSSLAAALTCLLMGACTAQNPAYQEPAVAPPAEDAAEPPDLAPPADARLTPDQATTLDAAPPVATPDAAVPADAAVPPDAAPDLPVDRGPPGTALLVVGETNLRASDVQLRDTLTRLGFTVVVKNGTAATAADGNGKALVVISGSSWSDDVGAKFRDVPVPVVCFDRALFSPMKLTGTRSGTDFGEVDNERNLLIIDDTHALAGGLSGQVQVANGDIMVSWGVPAAGAIKVATTIGNTGRYTIFGYLAGTPMVGMTAPARRVGSFVRYPYDTTFTESGLLLFEASALWAIGYR